MIQFTTLLWIGLLKMVISCHIKTGVNDTCA